MLKIGIVGLPNVGKSTLFKALTKKQVVIANYPFATIDPNIGVVEIPDERLGQLAKLSNSKKTIPAIIEFVDIAGLVKGASQGLGLGNAFLSNIRDVDAILQVVRVFKDSNIIHVEKDTDPVRDLEIINLELILKDLDIVSKALTKAESEAKNGDKVKVKRREVLQKTKNLLDQNKLLYSHLDADEIKIAYEIGLLTYKSMLVVFNISELELTENWEPGRELKEKLEHTPYLTVPIGVEAIASDATSENEQSEIYELVGIKEKVLDRLIKKSYETLNLMTFFTTGEDETRAWTIPIDSKAPRAGRA